MPLFRRHGATHGFGTSSTPLALDCAQNMHAAVDRHMPEERALAGWLDENAAAFGLGEVAFPEEWDGLGRSRRSGPTVAAWGKVKGVLDAAAAVLPSPADAPINCWTATISAALEFDPASSRIVALALHYVLDKRVERLFDAISACRGGAHRLSRDAGLFALLLRAPTAEIATRLAFRQFFGVAAPASLDGPRTLAPADQPRECGWRLHT